MSSNNYSLTRKYILSQSEKGKSFEVYLKNSKRLQGKITSVEEKTFIITCDRKGGSLVYFDKVSSVNIKCSDDIPDYVKAAKTSYGDDNFGNCKQPKTTPSIRTKRSKQFGTRKFPSDVEQDRRYGFNTVGNQ